MFSEFVATFGLLAVIWGCARRRSAAVPFAVGAYITAAYWFTASTSFANPAVTLARAASDTFAGIRPADVPGFVRRAAPRRGGRDALFRWLVPTLPDAGGAVVATARGARDDAAARFVPVHPQLRAEPDGGGFPPRDGGDRFEVESAGTEETRVNPLAIQAMSEVGIDLSGHRSKTLDRFLDAPWDYVITVCDSANERCPIFPRGAQRLHWSFEDPIKSGGHRRGAPARVPAGSRRDWEEQSAPGWRR